MKDMGDNARRCQKEGQGRCKEMSGEVGQSLCIGPMLEGGAKHCTSVQKMNVQHRAVKHQQTHMFL